MSHRPFLRRPPAVPATPYLALCLNKIGDYGVSSGHPAIADHGMLLALINGQLQNQTVPSGWVCRIDQGDAKPPPWRGGARMGFSLLKSDREKKSTKLDWPCGLGQSTPRRWRASQTRWRATLVLTPFVNGYRQELYR